MKKIESEIFRDFIRQKSYAFRLLAVSMIFLMPKITLAQNSSSHSNSISIGVAQGLSLYVDRGLAFGTIVQQAGTVSVALTSSSAGEVTIYGQKNRSVYVTLTPPAALVNGGYSISYTPQAAYNSSTDNPVTAVVWSNPTGLQSAIQLQGNIHGQGGEAYVYLYGSINVGNVAPGLYSGNFVVAVTY